MWKKALKCWQCDGNPLRRHCYFKHSCKSCRFTGFFARRVWLPPGHTKQTRMIQVVGTSLMFIYAYSIIRTWKVPVWRGSKSLCFLILRACHSVDYTWKCFDRQKGKVKHDQKPLPLASLPFHATAKRLVFRDVTRFFAPAKAAKIIKRTLVWRLTNRKLACHMTFFMLDCGLATLWQKSQGRMWLQLKPNQCCRLPMRCSKLSGEISTKKNESNPSIFLWLILAQLIFCPAPDAELTKRFICFI